MRWTFAPSGKGSKPTMQDNVDMEKRIPQTVREKEGEVKRLPRRLSLGAAFALPIVALATVAEEGGGGVRRRVKQQLGKKQRRLELLVVIVERHVHEGRHVSRRLGERLRIH